MASRGDDDNLVTRFTAGDQTAFDEIVAMYRERMSRLAFRLLGWSGDVDDVLQDVFLSAYTGLKGFQGRSGLGTWLTRITVNKCRVHQRKRRLRLSLVAGLQTLFRINANSSLPGDPDTLEHVRNAIRNLPAMYREVIVLRYLEEMPVGQIGELLGLTENAVSVRLNRARAAIKDVLGPYMEEQVHDRG